MRQGNVPPEPASLSERRLSDAHETISANRHFVQFRARFRGGGSGAPRRARTPPPHTLTGGRGGDSNPRGLSPWRFSRPLPSTARPPFHDYPGSLGGNQMVGKSAFWRELSGGKKFGAQRLGFG